MLYVYEDVGESEDGCAVTCCQGRRCFGVGVWQGRMTTTKTLGDVTAYRGLSLWQLENYINTR